MKKTYIKPTYEVVKLKLHQQMLAGSPASANGLNGADEEEYNGEAVVW